MIDKFFLTLVWARKIPFIGNFAYLLLKVLGVEIPTSVVIGKNVSFPHWSYGFVCHNNTVIEDNVVIYQGVTIGRADIYKEFKKSKFEGVRICEGAVICAGAKILCKSGVLVVGENTVIGANSVLLESTGKNEIWAGNPASCIGQRQ